MGIVNGTQRTKASGFGLFFGVLTTLASVGSLLMLVKMGFEVGFHGPFQRMLDEYEFWVHALFGWWAEPAVKMLLASLREWTGIALNLTPEWKHMFLLLWLYLSAGAKVDRGDRGLITVAFTLAWGGMIALVVSILFSSMAQGGSLQNAAAAIIPITGIAIYEIGRRVWNATFFRIGDESWSSCFLREARTYVLPVATIGGIVIAMGVALHFGQFLNGFKAPGLLLMLTFVFLLSVKWLIRGVERAWNDRGAEETWTQRFLRSGSGRMGVYMFTAIGGTLAFLLANAGTALLARL